MGITYLDGDAKNRMRLLGVAEAKNIEPLHKCNMVWQGGWA